MDKNLQDIIIILGIPEEAAEKSWEDCAEKVEHWLANKLGGTSEQYNRQIHRCHRDTHNPNHPGPRQIVCVVWFRTVKKVRKLFENGKKGKGRDTERHVLP